MADLWSRLTCGAGIWEPGGGLEVQADEGQGCTAVPLSCMPSGVKNTCEKKRVNLQYIRGITCDTSEIQVAAAKGKGHWGLPAEGAGATQLCWRRVVDQ